MLSAIVILITINNWSLQVARIIGRKKELMQALPEGYHHIIQKRLDYLERLYPTD